MSERIQHEEIKIFKEYLQIPSVYPNVDYEPCVKFLKKQARHLGLPLRVCTPGGIDKPIVIITLVGLEPELPSILLNSHMDVVAVYPENWTHPPFAAEVDSSGRIIARGTQDMKSVAMQYLAAFRALQLSGTQLKRTIHLSYVPDEEVGGKLGMGAFVRTDDFKALNVGFCLDEGMTSSDDKFFVFCAERSIWQIQFRITGTSGHGSLFLENTVGEKLTYLLQQFSEFRKQEENRLKNNSSLTVGDVTTVNLTRINGGKQSNVIPPLLVAVFDIRLAITVNHTEFENIITKWCEEAGGGIEIVYEQKEPHVEATKLDSGNVYWTAFSEAIQELGLTTKIEVLPAGTDSRYIREIGIPAIGFSPINNTPVLAHDNDEFITVDTYLKGIDIYKTILSKVANISNNTRIQQHN